MNKIGIRNIEVEIPSKWSEIDKRNLLYLATKFPFQKTYGFALYFFFHVLNLPKKPLLAFAIARNFILSKKLNLAWKNDQAMEYGEENIFETQILIALHQLDNFEWLHTDMQFEKCLIDKFSVNLKKFYGPREYLSNVTSDEFRHAEFFFINYYKTSDIYFLDRLIATLWRRKNSANSMEDIRVPFSEFDIEQNVKKIKKLPDKLKFACLLCYTGMRNFLVNTDAAKAAFDGAESGSGNVLNNWGITLLRIAENSTFGSMQEIKKTFISEIILYISDMKLRNERLTQKN